MLLAELLQRQPIHRSLLQGTRTRNWKNRTVSNSPSSTVHAPIHLLARWGLLTTIKPHTSQSVGTSHNLLPHLGHRYPPFFNKP